MAKTDDSQSQAKPTRSMESIQRAPKQASAPKATPVTSPTDSPTAPATQPTGKSSTLKIVLIVVGVLIALSILGSIAASFMAKSIFEGGFSALSGGKAKVSTKDGSVTLKGDNGSAELSTSQKLPSGFPADVPVYQPSTIKFSATLGRGLYNVTFSTNDSDTAVVKYYDKELPANGWAIKENSHVTFGSVSTTTYTKGKSDLVVVITGAGNGTAATAVSLSYRADAGAQ